MSCRLAEAGRWDFPPVNQVLAMYHEIMQPEHVPDREVLGTQHRLGRTDRAKLVYTDRGPLPLRGRAEPRDWRPSAKAQVK